MIISLDPDDTRPVYQQIISCIKQQIRLGQIQTGEELPSVRDVAEHLGINHLTVHKAYNKLKEQGVVSLRLGQRARIAKLNDEPADHRQVMLRVEQPLRDAVAEAYHLGVSPDQLIEMLQSILQEDKQ